RREVPPRATATSRPRARAARGSAGTIAWLAISTASGALICPGLARAQAGSLTSSTKRRSTPSTGQTGCCFQAAPPRHPAISWHFGHPACEEPLMAATPAFVGTPRTWLGQVSAANTNRDGTGTLVDIVSAGALGSRLDQIEVVAIATTTAGVVR